MSSRPPGSGDTRPNHGPHHHHELTGHSVALFGPLNNIIKVSVTTISLAESKGHCSILGSAKRPAEHDDGPSFFSMGLTILIRRPQVPLRRWR